MGKPVAIALKRGTLTLATLAFLFVAACRGAPGGDSGMSSVDASGTTFGGDSSTATDKDSGANVGSDSGGNGVDASQSGGVQDGALLIGSALSFSETVVNPGDTVTGTVTFTNNGTASVTVQGITIAARPPGGTHSGGPFDDFAPLSPSQTLSPGGSVTVTATRAFTASDLAGAWDVYPTWEDSSKAWHDGPDSSLTVTPHDAGTGGIVPTMTLSGSETASLEGNTYVLQADEWPDASAPFSIASDGNVDFEVTSDNLSNTVGDAPGAYPSFYYGCHWGACTANSGLPLSVPAIKSPGAVTSDFNCTNDISGSWDNSFDIWFNAPATAGNNGDNGLEMMVWLANGGGTRPAGNEVATNVPIGGLHFNVYYGNGGTAAGLLSPTSSPRQPLRSPTWTLAHSRPMPSRAGTSRAPGTSSSVEAGFRALVGRRRPGHPFSSSCDGEVTERRSGSFTLDIATEARGLGWKPGHAHS